MDCVGLAAFNPASGEVIKHNFQRRTCGVKDVLIEISFCGICRSDFHTINGHWGWKGDYPVVPGHEITGTVLEIGAEVLKFLPGDKVGVGCFVDSCRTCENCTIGKIQYCKGSILTYNSNHPTDEICKVTAGGYSSSIVVDEAYIIRIPEGMAMDSAAPLLCAGITVYSPLMYFENAKEGGKRIGVVGFGGLGHMAVKIGKALGNDMFVFSTSIRKKQEVEALGATFVLTTDENEMKALESSFNLLLDTIGERHLLSAELALLKIESTLCMLGGVPQPFSDVSAFALIYKRISLAGSLVGGISETQDMIDFCFRNNIAADIELISAESVNVALEKLRHCSNDKSRFVIDIKGSLNESTQVQPLALSDYDKR